MEGGREEWREGGREGWKGNRDGTEQTKVPTFSYKPY